MKGSVAMLAAVLAGSSEAFVVPAVPLRASTSGASVCMSASEGRRTFVERGVVSIIGLVGAAQSVSAAKYFGDKEDYPEVVKPSEAVKDADKLKEVSSKIDTIRGYLSAVKDLEAELQANPQSDLRPRIRKSFEFSKLRTVLNDANAVFDEDSQRGTDRLIRAILQDAVEFEDAAKVKPGMARSSRKVEIMSSKLKKMDKAFTDLLAFF